MYNKIFGLCGALIIAQQQERRQAFVCYMVPGIAMPHTRWFASITRIYAAFVLTIIYTDAFYYNMSFHIRIDPLVVILWKFVKKLNVS